jgi:hypothetical protein
MDVEQPEQEEGCQAMDVDGGVDDRPWQEEDEEEEEEEEEEEDRIDYTRARLSSLRQRRVPQYHSSTRTFQRTNPLGQQWAPGFNPPDVEVPRRNVHVSVCNTECLFCEKCFREFADGDICIEDYNQLDSRENEPPILCLGCWDAQSPCIKTTFRRKTTKQSLRVISRKQYHIDSFNNDIFFWMGCSRLLTTPTVDFKSI